MSLLAASLLLTVAHAEVVRHAVIVGVNGGPPGLAPLRYAEDDARRMAEVLTELGGFPAEQVTVLYGPDASELQSALSEHAAVARAAKDDLFLFYYSGHADPSGLRLGEETVSYTQLRRQVRDIPAEVRVGVLDACRSGEITRIKGLEVTAPFASPLVPAEGLDTQGEAWITAAAAEESAQESDTLKSSFFTHYLVSGLRGAADGDDGLVSLGEAYAYAYARTVSRTGHTSGGTQHPAYDFRLAGRGDLPLTDVRRASARLVLPEELSGELLVMRLPDEAPMVEVSKRAGERVDVGLPPGQYLLRLRDGGSVQEARAGLSEGASLEVRGFSPAALALAVSKGEAAPGEAAEAVAEVTVSPPTDALPLAIPVDEAPPPGADPRGRPWAGLNRAFQRTVAQIDAALSPVAEAIPPRLRTARVNAPETPDEVSEGFLVPLEQRCAEPEAVCAGPLPAEAARPDGRVSLLDEAGHKVAEGRLIAGQRSGRWVFWFDDGVRQAEGAYVNGVRTGTWTWWHDNGQRALRGTYANGRREGLWTEWHDNGRRRRQVAYRADQPDGRFTAWHENGIHAQEGRMRAGQPDGPWSWWFDNGALSAKGRFERGARVGPWTTWHDNGVRASQGQYRADRKEGPWLSWWENGRVASRGRYRGDEPLRLRQWDRDGRRIQPAG